MMTVGKHADLDPSERNRIAIRATIVLVIVVTLFFGWVGIKIINFNQDLKRQSAANHQSRLEDQARTDRRIAQLACLVVSQTNENKPGFSPSARVAIQKFRAFYGCPPYSAKTARDPFGKAAQPTPTRPVPTGFVPTGVPGAPTTTANAGADKKPTPKGKTTAPTAHRTPSSHPTSSSSAPKPKPSSSTSSSAPPAVVLKVCPGPLPVVGTPLCLKVS